MKIKFLAIVMLLLVSVAPAFAQTDASHTVAFDNFSFKYDPAIAPNVDIYQAAGDPKDLEQPGGPEVRHTEFLLYKELPVPANYDAPAVINVYNVADFAGYDFQQKQFDQLKELLNAKPDLKQYMEVHQDMTQDKNLPFIPVFPAAQVIRARAQYVETAQVKGVSFITVFRQDVSPFTGSEFIYTFQGLSADGQYYVSARFHFTTALFPKEIPSDFNYDEFNKTFTQYNIDSVDKLNNAQPTDFTPQLSVFDQMIQSFAFIK